MPLLKRTTLDSFDEGQEDEEDIDEELNLPDILLSIGLKEKRELLSYKRNHNEVKLKIFMSDITVFDHCHIALLVDRMGVGACSSSRITRAKVGYGAIKTDAKAQY